MKKLPFLSMVFLVIGCCLFSENSLEKDIDFLVENNIERPVNGVILVAQGDKILYKKKQGCYGNPKLSDAFLIGSLSKQVTAAVMLRLVDLGLIDIDQPIKKYLPDLLDDWASLVTIKHLLNHTSGIRALGQPLQFDPGTIFAYSPTVAYYLCSQIAKAVTGKSFELLLPDLVSATDGAKMNVAISKLVEDNRKKYPHLAKGFKESGLNHIEEIVVIGENGHIFDTTWCPGGGILATAHSLLQWNLALHGGKILSEESYKKMVTPSAVRKHPRYGTIGYGLGLQVVDQWGILELSHSGYIDGYISTILYYPHSKVSVIILENVSWDISDVKRAFSFHDHLRDYIRIWLTQSQLK